MVCVCGGACCALGAPSGDPAAAKTWAVNEVSCRPLPLPLPLPAVLVARGDGIVAAASAEREETPVAALVRCFARRLETGFTAMPMVGGGKAGLPGPAAVATDAEVPSP